MASDKTNGAKISRLLIDVGTPIFQEVLNNIVPPARLRNTLDNERATLQELLNTRVINDVQWRLLFPHEGQPDSRKFDIILLCTLFRNICGLAHSEAGVWNREPRTWDTSLEADVVRIRSIRHKCHAHITTTGIADPKFHDTWMKLSEVLVRRGADKSKIDRLKVAPLEEDKYIDLMTKWKSKEDHSKVQVQEMDAKLNQMLNQTNGKVVIGDIEFYNDEAHQIAEGSEGTQLFEGIIRSTGERVAVKVMFDGICDKSEAKRLKSLNHPNIIKLRGVGKKDRFTYLALEFYQKTLSNCVEDNYFQLEGSDIKQLQCLQGITAAVEHIHKRNLCHQYIGPDSIWLSTSDPERFVLANFNIAKNVTSAPTRVGNPTGPIGYMGPERNRLNGRITTKNDLFALGCVFFHVLTNGGHPFGPVENLQECQASIFEGKQPTLQEKAFGEHAWIAQMVQRMLHPDPAQRPSAEEVLKFLEEEGQAELKVETEDGAPKDAIKMTVAETSAAEVTGLNTLEETGADVSRSTDADVSRSCELNVEPNKVRVKWFNDKTTTDEGLMYMELVIGEKVLECIPVGDKDLLLTFQSNIDFERTKERIQLEHTANRGRIELERVRSFKYQCKKDPDSALLQYLGQLGNMTVYKMRQTSCNNLLLVATGGHMFCALFPSAPGGPLMIFSG